MVAIAACVNHPEREALGICIRCRTRVCSECVTKVDGINYCVTCLAIMAVQSTPRSELKERKTFVMARLVASIAVLVALTWALLESMLPGVS